MKSSRCLILVILVVLANNLLGCKKEENKIQPDANIILWNQPPQVISQYIQGDWKYEKYSVGIIGSNVYSPVDNGELHINGDSIKLWGNGHNLEINTVFTWTKVGPFIFPDSAYAMDFGAPMWFVRELREDTLITADYAYDGSDHYFIRK